MVAAGGLLLGFCPKVTRPETIKRRQTKALAIVAVPVYFYHLAFSPRPAPSQPSVIFPQINGVLSLSGHRQRTFDLVGCRGFTQSPLRKTSRESSRRTTIARYARHPVGFRHFPLVPPTRWSVTRRIQSFPFRSSPFRSLRSLSVSVIAVGVISVSSRWSVIPSVSLSPVGQSVIRRSVCPPSVCPPVRKSETPSVHCPKHRTVCPLSKQ